MLQKGGGGYIELLTRSVFPSFFIDSFSCCLSVNFVTGGAQKVWEIVSRNVTGSVLDTGDMPAPSTHSNLVRWSLSSLSTQ